MIGEEPTALAPEPPPDPPQAPRDPPWSYSDVFLLAGLAVPCMLLGWAVVRGILALFRFRPANRITELLPEQLIGYLLLFLALSAVLRIQYGLSFWRGLGWNEFHIPVVWVSTCGMLLAFAVAIVGTLIRTPTTANPMTELMQNRTSAILMAIFGTTVAPLSEELLFRGFLQPLLVRSLGALPGILLASLPFGLLHLPEYGYSWRHVLLIALAGAAFGWMRHVTGSTRASTVMHAFYNGIMFVAVFSQGRHLPGGA